ncbi:MAG: Gfo/Idh/MocA family oxidoreductase [Phycisphaerae bacterium]|nr:Gfo/Idh/MocA family oxidoreductase [Phycisphaerae bacterium]
MKCVRVGIVGVGMAGRYHIECLRRVHGVKVDVVGVTSRRQESREAFAAEYGVRAFDTVEALIEQVDLLDVCSPPLAHEANIVAAARAGKHVVCEKPLTGYFGPSGDKAFRGNRAAKEPMLAAVRESMARIREAVESAGVVFGYAENFVYAPAVQKEAEVIRESGAQVLRMLGEESHSGSHSPDYGIWNRAGGGSLVGKGCHPLTALLYLKRVEGEARGGKPIRPAAVSGRTHELTRIRGYRDAGFLRTDYHDIEDYGWMHVVFEDGTVGDVVTGETTLGGIYDYVEVFANNHRARCRLNPVSMLDAYNPKHEQMADLYFVEKITTNEGWMPTSANEDYTMGYQDEAQDFVTCAAEGRQPICDLDLAIDTMNVIYAAYVSEERGGAEVAVRQ